MTIRFERSQPGPSDGSSDLDPWPVVCGFLTELWSDDVVTIINKAGLRVDWTLTEEQDHSHKTRLRAYMPRILAAYERLPNDRRLVVAALVAKDLAGGDPDRSAAMSARLHEIGWSFDGERLSPGTIELEEMFFPRGSQHDAYKEIRTILQSATIELAIVDPYIDSTVFPLLSTIRASRIHVLTSKLSSDFAHEGRKFLGQYPQFLLEVRTTAEFHDRFVILDGARCYHLGASIKDAGNRAFMISQVQDPSNRNALLGQHHTSWSTASPVVV